MSLDESAMYSMNSTKSNQKETFFKTKHKQTFFLQSKQFLYQFLDIPVKLKGCPLTSPWKQASFTIEASVVLPFFLFFSISILFFMRILCIEWGISTALYDVTRTAALCPAQMEEKEGSHSQAILTTAIAAGAVDARIKELNVPLHFISGEMMGITFLDSNITDKEVFLQVRYRIRMPVSVFGWRGFVITQQAKARKWVGRDPTEDMLEDGYVFITKYGSHYHTSLECPYLNPKIQMVEKNQLKKLRNQSGAKYKRCLKCYGKTGRYVFITEYGRVYHKSLQCRALRRTIQRKKLTEVSKKYHICSKCKRERKDGKY